MEHDLAQLLRFVAAHGPASLAKAGKALGLAQSELRRLLVVLGDDPEGGGLGLVDVIADADGRDGRVLLALSARGRAWLEQHR
jgi:hypothetical protein